MEAVTGFIEACVIVFLFFLPSFIASKKGKKNTTAIFVANLLFGWTGLGWAIILIWACMND